MNPILGDEDVAVIAPCGQHFRICGKVLRPWARLKTCWWTRTPAFSADPHRQGLRDVNIVISLDRKN